MCELTTISKRKTATGYKVLAMKDNKFYSSFTGQELTIGDVPKAPTRATRLSYYWRSDLDIKHLKHCTFYSARFDGHTSMFATKKLTVHEFSNIVSLGIYKLVIVKLTLTGTIYNGIYSGTAIIAGNKIKSFDTIYELNGTIIKKL